MIGLGSDKKHCRVHSWQDKDKDKNFTWICWSCYFDLSTLFYVFLVNCKKNWSLTKFLKLVEASALNYRCLISQSNQCLSFGVPFAMLYLHAWLPSSRLSISNNMDVLRDKLFTAINGKPGSPNDQGKMANLKVFKCNFKYFHIIRIGAAILT